MNCRSAESHFSAYLEDEVSQEERRALEAHLMGCRRCTLTLRELRATLSVLQTKLPAVETSSHFEEDVLARIRSGEGLRPSVSDWIRDLLQPARLKPVFMAGVAMCAVYLGVTLYPAGRALLATKTRTVEPAASVSVAPAPAVTHDTPVASAPAPATERSGHAVVASLPHRVTARDSVAQPMPPQRYTDEIINDQFYLDRGLNSGSAPSAGEDPTVVPVNEQSDDGTYIIF